jgi:hypothetical protein
MQRNSANFYSIGPSHQEIVVTVATAKDWRCMAYSEQKRFLLTTKLLFLHIASSWGLHYNVRIPQKASVFVKVNVLSSITLLHNIYYFLILFIILFIILFQKFCYKICPFAVHYESEMFYSTGPNVIQLFMSVIYGFL